MFSNQFFIFGDDTGQLRVGNPFATKIIQRFSQLMQAPTMKHRDSEIPPTGGPSWENEIVILILLGTVHYNAEYIDFIFLGGNDDGKIRTTESDTR